MESKLKLEVGETYITAGGNECDIVYRNENVTDGYEFIGLVKEHHLNEKRNTNCFKDFLTKFDKNGRAANASDIVKKKPKIKTVEYWLIHWYNTYTETILIENVEFEKDADDYINRTTKNHPNYIVMRKEHVVNEVEIE